MLNESQARFLRVVLTRIEEKVRAIERQIAHPEGCGVLIEWRTDTAPEMEEALQRAIRNVYAVIGGLKEQFELAAETRLASRELAKGLPQLWAMLQESDARSLRRYGAVAPGLSPVLDPQIETLARLMLELEDLAIGHPTVTRPAPSD
jgi:DNA-directed RNA polymerase subunit L